MERFDELIAQLETARAKLEVDPDPDDAIEVLHGIAELAKAATEALEQARRESAP
jgi:exonuclease VII small subunit